MKIAVITCYFDPDYVRARTIRSAVKAYPGAKMIVVKNHFRGWLRYPEIIWKMAEVRRKQKPDVYLLTFRGQEILLALMIIAGLKPIIFDEFIVPVAYATSEQHRRSLPTTIKHFLARVSEPFYRIWLRHCRFILADTQAHAELSARTSHVNLRQYRVVPVGADEELFKPSGESKPTLAAKPFTVFFYGLFMTPLHGLDVIFEAARQLKDNPDITFHILGGNKHTEVEAEALITEGAHISYNDFIPFEELPATIHESALCLGGPFGGTPQAQHVITGKEYQFLACGVATVVGESEATTPYFTDKDTALVVPQADAEALVSAITWASKHRDELVEIGRRGRQLYEREFSSQVIARDIKSLLDEVA